MNRLYFVIFLLSFGLLLTYLTLGAEELNKNNIQNIEEKTEEVESENVEINPTENYKLIAVYLVNKKPKALIKDIANIEEGTKEFGVGDFLDQLQTVSIAKISINPTTRVEIVDQNGLSYLLKQSILLDDKASIKTKSSPYSKSVPSYTYGKSYKSKYKREETQDAAPTSATGGDTKKESIESTIKKDSTSEPTQPALQDTSTSLKPAGKAESETSVAKTSGKETTKESAAKTDMSLSTMTSDNLDVSRPSNPFGE